MSHDAVPPPPPPPPGTGPYQDPPLPDPPTGVAYYGYGSPAHPAPPGHPGYPGQEGTAPSPAPSAAPSAAMAVTTAGAAAPVGVGTTGLLGVLLVGAAVSVVLGVYGRLHSPTGVAVNISGFSGPQEVKVWLATLVFVLALVQLSSALAMYGKLPVRAPSWTGTLHRWSGRLAFLAAIPVAMHCLYALGFQAYDLRVLLHSLMGCLFFGAFAVKMLSLSRSGLPGWLLPVFGGAVFTGLTVLWLTSSLWFFTTVGVRL